MFDVCKIWLGPLKGQKFAVRVSQFTFVEGRFWIQLQWSDKCFHFFTTTRVTAIVEPIEWTV